MIAIIYRVSLFGQETFRRFSAEQREDIATYVGGIQPGCLLGHVMSLRAETCRPGRPRGDVEVGPFLEVPPV